MKIIKYPAIALAALALCTACEDDNDDNPTVAQATEFQLNTPTFVNTIVDLEQTDSLGLSWSQPNYGCPILVNYNVELSKTGEFTTSYAQQVADETGATVADYYEMDGTTLCAGNVAGKDVCRALASLSSWSGSDDVPNSQDIYVRVKASPYTVSGDESLVCYSNIVKFTSHPYYIALKDADPEMWYLIGACIGDGAWTNTPEALGTSNFTMSIIADQKYDSNTGKGVLTFTGYFTTAGFKIIRVRGDWTDQWGMNDGAFVFQDGGSGNIVVEEDGYYTVTLDNSKNEISIAAYEEEPTVYTEISISGDFNGWGDTPMTAFNTVDGVVNHLWSYEFSTDVATTLKFKTTGSWDTNWGGTGFPYGIGVGNGANIDVPEGNWIITFNDIDGSYAFTAK